MKNVFKRNIIIYIILIEFLLLLISNNILAYIYILNAFIIKFFFCLTSFFEYNFYIRFLA